MDAFKLDRFTAAQAPVIDIIRRELADGRKRSHWMWFIFPQIEGLGFSAMSQRYAISGLEEAKAYLAHPVLGRRLLECTRLAMQSGNSALDIFGPIDAQKLRSCLTLFAAASDDPVFPLALAQFFNGERDDATLTKLTA
ncbi:DUF1810 domain-containing protein [Acidocella aromatica]|uniref:Uncharacterized protein (DUF1810 family) n=1 Tax=Acidocella aromatica TaxID=1303579 RepID=A0A840VCQ6_9PROT|nr:DUF1810 domain-containing protein [Acidocella aromatica]MBB5373464.1 uncharacterized protein (DUF1810 family) [Acidocella aromatica]